ncbi:MAG: TonB-dependent receptor [Deltaproteobacteria bacterium]|nr:TonB-dependent receptor [Deltaproteobacteria bacterium]
MMFTSRRAVILTVAAAVAFGLPGQTWAQAKKKAGDKPEAGMEVGVEEITVTAEKREESLQETPVSVTAITSEAIEEKGIRDVIDLGQVAPNLHMHPNVGGSTGVTVNMRGVIRTDPIITNQPKVGLYTDGVYIAKSSAANAELSDIERIEVLRGPQGTLWGRNANGGAVNFITKKPTSEKSISAKTEVGNYEQFKGSVILNTPVIGKGGLAESEGFGTLNLRQVADYRSRDGFYDNTGDYYTDPTTGRKQRGGSGDFANLDRVATSTSLRWEPAKSATIDYNFEYRRHVENPSASQLTYVYPNAPGAQPLVPYIEADRADAIANNSLLENDVTRGPYRQQVNHGNARAHTVTAAFDLAKPDESSNVTLKSISSYRTFTQQEDQDVDGSPLHYGDFELHHDVAYWSQELQLLGTFPRLKWVLGGYYYGEHGDEQSGQVLYGGATNLAYNDVFNVRSYAPYAQGTYTFPFLDDRLSLTLGVRYTQEQVHHGKQYSCYAIMVPDRNNPGQFTNICNVGIPSFKNFSVAHGRAFGGWDAVSPMGSIAFQATDDFMFYVRASRGFQSGGFNGRATTEEAFAQNYDPETLEAYEGGIKSQWLDNRLQVNASMFFSDYHDLQVAVFRASQYGGAVSTLQNAASANIWGSELEVVAVPLRGIEASVTYGYIDPTYKEFMEQALDAMGNPVLDSQGNPERIDVSDQRQFVLTPKHAVTVGLSYTAPPTDRGTFSAHMDTYWQDDVVFLVDEHYVNNQGDYGLLNGRVQLAGIPLQHGSLDVAVFAHNLLDRKYRTFGVDFGPQLGWAVNQYGDPRTFGLQLAYNFTAS